MRRCCVSKARAVPERASLLGGEKDGNHDTAAALAGAELYSLKLSQLRKRAEKMGVSDALVEEAEDGEDPRGALVALLLGAASSSTTNQTLREELLSSGLKVSALRKLARATPGVDEGELDDAGDGPAPREAIVDLIIAAGRHAAPSASPGAAELVAPPDAGVVDDQEDPAVVALRQELSSLKLKKLKSRARELGVGEEALEDADDADDVKAAVIGLCIEAVMVGEGGGEEMAAMRAELAPLKLKALKKRAREAGVSVDDLDDADDADDVKQAVTDLIIVATQEVAARGHTAASDKPHFGSAPAEAQPKAQRTAATKHVMLSYQWDHQAVVKRAYDTLTQLGINCWMDIAGGMSADIYESMAEGVSNASVVVCFMSQSYQESENCTLEVKYAKQCGVEIIPVMMEGSGWRATGYLGIITAGALWTRLSDESQFEENIRQLHRQIQKVIGAVVPEDLGVTDEGIATASEAKEELERLRDGLASKDDTASSAVLADPSQPATVPAGVPKLPAKFQSTEQIQELTRLVLSTAARDMTKSRVGFWGMGGIGKTVTGAAIVRDERVRKHFDVIIWLPLGQTPVIAKLQNLCHMQCMGKELSAELSSDEKQEALQQAMSGKRVLLCLDDLWEEEHELKLNFADESAGSKVLISTRMKALLNGGHQVEVGLPSPSDSARMLLAAADAEISGSQPSGVSEIVDLCGRLPLALGIAGRLAASLGLVGTQDWSDMIGVLKEELRESHSSVTEEGMIRASLRGLKGSAQEQANVRSLLLMFAFVPEDTYCPLEVMLLMFNAVNEGSDTTMMHIRKWLRILLNRSLVLGTIDRPSVHDLVLDFSVAQHNADALRMNHRRIVEAFRAARVVDVHGRRKFDVAQKNDPVSVYVCHEIQYHVEQGWQANKLSDDLALSGWLTDVPQDAIVVAAGRVLGPEQMTELAETAEASKDWWLAARYWAIVQSVLPPASVAGLGPTVKALDAMAAQGRIFETEVEKEDFELAQVAALAAVWDFGGDLSRRPELVERVLSSKAATRDLVSVGTISIVTKLIPMYNSFDDRIFANAQDATLKMLRLAKSDPDPVARSKTFAMAYNFSQFPLNYLHPGFSWDAVYGEGGETLIAAFNAWDVETMHSFLTRALGGDWFYCWTLPCAPLAVHWGDMSTVYANLDRVMTSTSVLIADADAQELGPIWVGSVAWQTFVWSCRMPADRCQAVANVFAAAGLTWSGAAEVTDECAKKIAFVRERGDKDTSGLSHPAEQMLGPSRCGSILMASDPRVTEDEIMLDLPSVDEIIELSVRATNGMHDNGLCKLGCFMHHSHLYVNWFLSCAAVSAKFGRHIETLAYAVAGLVPDCEKAGTKIPQTRILLMTLQANALAALGRKGEASAAFEAAADEAHRAGMFLYEAFALRDLKVNVLDSMGHGEHGSRRVGAVLRLLTGPAELLTELLGGLDAAELMALPPPDANYRIETEQSDFEYLRRFYQFNETGRSASSEWGVEAWAEEDWTAKYAKILSTYKKKAAKKGHIGGEADYQELLYGELKDKYGIDPRALPPTVSAAAGGRAEDEGTTLREQLLAMKVTALQKRAQSQGISEGQIEDAIDSDSPKGNLIELIMKQETDYM